jgi:hypothetical protein
MTAEEYAEAQAAISAELVATVLELSSSYRLPTLTIYDWRFLLELLFPFVYEARKKSAELGRRFYDSQRKEHHPELPRRDIYLAEYRLDWFTEEMFPARDDFLETGASEGSLAQVALRAAKAVENGGRRTILRAVEEDNEVLGWARVATGRETCGFCMMLVSRGPAYKSARGAGLNASDELAEQLWASGDAAALKELMTRWHPGCDCKVVPVFDKASWPGRDAYKRALDIWKKETRGYRGKDAMNAFRRAIENGDVDVRKMSIAA